MHSAMGLYDAMKRLERFGALDRQADKLAGAVGNTIKPGPVKDALSGTWLGHPLHPLMTDVAITAWAGANAVDLLAGADGAKASERLLGLGQVVALPTVASGLSDWADTFGPERRVGFVHALSNTTAWLLYGASYIARKRGRSGLGAKLALGGLAAIGVGGYLGGHLAYAQGVGVDVGAFEEGPGGWTDVMDATDLPEDELTGGEVDGIGLVLLREGATVRALSDRCTHRGGPLHEGKLEDGCVECPWHGSIFKLEDGSVVRGPATMPQRAYEARVTDGRVQVRVKA